MLCRPNICTRDLRMHQAPEHTQYLDADSCYDYRDSKETH